MATSYDVEIWRTIAKRNRKRGYGVRWRVEKKEFSKWFTTWGLADNHRTKLKEAVRKGEGFDTATGVPESTLRENRSVTWFDLACRYVDLKWPRAAAKTRTSTADALATVTPILVSTTRGAPDGTVS